MQISLNRNIIDMEYAVRGAIPRRAAELKRMGKVIIPCNIGNPQALGQPPVTFYRQVLSLVEDPARIAHERRLKNIFWKNSGELRGQNPDFISEYILNVSESFLAQMETGLGAYSDSNGPLFIRKAVAEFINRRDGFDTSSASSSDPQNIFITDGASAAAKYIIDVLIADKNDGIMIPIPQYPLYSAAIKKAGGIQVNYYLDEEAGWTLNRAVLNEALTTAHANGVKVKGIVVINPGNPTGGILDEGSISQVIDFAEEHDMVIIADEVYQQNTYGAKWVSFAKVLGQRPVPLFSLHSISKGFCGECGHRGGYIEMRNPPGISGTEISFPDVLLKQASVSLCSNTVGQLLVYMMVSPPPPGSEPYEQFIKEKQTILNEFYEKAVMIRQGFEQMDSMKCFGRIGAMYLFPRLDKLPAGTDDFDYCMSLLEATGLCTINGSGFGQRPGTNHLRIAFLPPKELIEQVMPRWIKFHNDYVNKTVIG